MPSQNLMANGLKLKNGVSAIEYESLLFCGVHLKPKRVERRTDELEEEYLSLKMDILYFCFWSSKKSNAAPISK